MIVTTTPTLEGYTIKEYKGIVSGEVIFGMNFVKDFLVNSFEVNVSKDGIITFRNNVFRSASAIEMLNHMWNL